MRSFWKNKNVKKSRELRSGDDKKLATSLKSFVKELGLRTLAVAIWDTVKGYIM